MFWTMYHVFVYIWGKIEAIILIIIMNCQKTRMVTFMIAKLNKSSDQTNIDKYRVAANIIEYYIQN